MTRTAALIVSPAAKAMSGTFLRHAVKVANARSLKRLVIIVLDSLEELNLSVIFDVEANTAKGLVRGMNRNIRWSLESTDTSVEVEIRSWEQMKACESVLPIVQTVLEAHRTDSSFRGHCMNQVWRNLQPVLEHRGITRRSSAVEKLSVYIAEELALKFHLAKVERIAEEFVVVREMDIVKDIYGIDGAPGKYSDSLRTVLPNELPQLVVLKPPGDDAVLDMSALGYQYASNAFTLGPIDMTVGSGELVGLVGPNGSGKSTLLRLIAGHLTPTAGQIIIGGRNVTHFPARMRPTATVFQKFGLFPHLTVRDNIAFGLRHWGGIRKGEAREEAARIAIAMGLERGLLGKRPAFLSTGQQQRLALARAVAVQPMLLLLDEPTSAFDQKQRELLVEYLKTTAACTRNRGFLIVTHDLAFANSVCNRLLTISEGKLVAVQQS